MPFQAEGEREERVAMEEGLRSGKRVRTGGSMTNSQLPVRSEAMKMTETRLGIIGVGLGVREARRERGGENPRRDHGQDRGPGQGGRGREEGEGGVEDLLPGARVTLHRRHPHHPRGRGQGRDEDGGEAEEDGDGDGQGRLKWLNLYDALLN